MSDVDLLGAPTFIIRSPYLPGTRFEGRPVERAPADNTTALLCRKNAQGYIKCGIGRFKDGKWTGSNGRPLKLKDLYWLKIANG